MTSTFNEFPGLKNAGWFKDAQKKSATGVSVEYVNPDGSEMADWTLGKVKSLKSPENANNVKALVEFLASEAGHKPSVYEAEPSVG